MSDIPLTGSRTVQLLENTPLVVGVLLLFDSLHFVFARLLRPYLPGPTAALLVLGLATVEITLFLGWQRNIQFGVLRRHFLFFVLIGALVAASTGLNYTAISFIDPGTASLLAHSSTVFALGFGLFWLKERLNRQQSVGATLVILGAFVISFQPGEYLRLGSLMVLGSALLYSFHAAVVKRYGGEIAFTNFFLFRVGMTTTFLLLYVVGTDSWVWPVWQAWLILLVAATTDVVISRMLYYWVLRRLQMSAHALLLTLSPVVAILWSVLLFGERPTLQGFLGGMVVIAGIIVVTRSRIRG